MAYVRPYLGIIISSTLSFINIIEMVKSNKNLLAWIVLISLTFTGFFISGNFDKNTFLILLVTLTLAKSLTILFQYMELKKAHLAWPIILGLILLVYAGAVVLFYGY